MKKILTVFIILIFALPSLAININAQSNSLQDIYNELPDSVTNNLPEGFEKEIQNGDGTNAVKSIDAGFILSFVFKVLSLAMGELSSKTFTLLVAIFISSVLSSVAKGYTGGISEALEFASSASVILICTSTLIPLWKEVSDTITALGIIIKASLPVMTAISFASGQPSGAAVNAMWLSSLLTLTDLLAEKILSPIVSSFIAFICLGALNRTSSKDNLSGVAETLKKVFLFFVTLISFLLTVIMSFQNVIAKGNDSVLIRSVKFASGSAIPIIGGALSEATGSYFSGLSVIKGAAGSLCAVSVVLSVLPIILKLLAFKGALLIVSLIGNMVGSKSAGVVKEFSSAVDFMIAITSLISVVFIIAVAVFASTVPSF